MVDPASNTVALRAVEILRYDPSAVIVSNGLRDGEVVVTAGVNVLHPGQKVKLALRRVMRRTFNLAEWSINHRPFVTFGMIMLLAAGAWSYSRLGRAEDPPFTVKDMIVQAQWPGRNDLRHPSSSHREDRKEGPGNAGMRN